MAVASLFEDLLDQYKLEQHIAEKRYTDLYLAYDIDDDRPVWLDIVRDSYAEDHLFVDQFINRARALARIRHPNINQVLHIGKAAGGAPYVAQTVVDGYLLTHRLEQLARRQTPANPIYALTLTRQLTDALLLAERLGIFHYDLQPDNVLLKNVALPTDDTVVLVDLFIPSNEASHARTGTDQSAYLSPEQRRGKEVTAASQVYSLGVLLYRLLVGELPYRSVAKSGMAIDRLFGRAGALERQRPDLAPATRRLIDRSLRKNPRRRYPTVEAFATDLDGALAAEELRLGAAVRPEPVERRPLAWIAIFLALALFLAMGAVAMNSLSGNDGRMQISNPPLSGTGAAAIVIGATRTQTPPPPESPSPTERPPDEEPTIGAGAPAGEMTIQATGPSATVTPEPTSTPSPIPTLEATAAATSEPAPLRVRVTYNLVNLRRGPGVIFPTMGSVRGGEMLEVIAWNDDLRNPWYLVITGDQRVGWIAATVVQTEEPDAIASIPVAATLPAAPTPGVTSEPTIGFMMTATIQPTTGAGDLGGGGATPPVEESTPPPVRPTLPPVELTPTSTPMPLPTDRPSP